MPKPLIYLRPVTPITGGASIDLSAITGGAAGDGQLAGYTGADWVWLESNVYGLNTIAYIAKSQGASQLVPAVLGTPNFYSTGNSFTDATIVFDGKESVTNGGNGYAGVATNVNSNVGDGLRYNNIFADRRRAQVFFQHYTYNGTWTVTASLSDNSYAPQQIQLTGNGLKGFACDFVCNADSGVTLNIDIVCTAMTTPGSNQSASLRPQLQWKPVPKVIFKPSLYKKYLMFTDFAGGANA